MSQLPKAPQSEGVDPLTKSPTYHSDDVKGLSTVFKAVEPEEAAAKPETTTGPKSKTGSKRK